MPQHRKHYDLFYWENHQRADAKLHEPILADGDHVAATASSVAVMRRLGFSKDKIASLLGDVKKAFDPSEPRDEEGKWTDGGGDSDGGDNSPGLSNAPLGAGYSKDAHLKDGKIHTSNVNDAVKALSENRAVELKQPRQVATLIKELGKVTTKMVEAGKKAPDFNLCNVSVKGSNLFCADTQGIPRIKMPQMDADQTKAFRQHLKDKGYKIEKTTERADHFRATQNQLIGAKVAATVKKIRDDPEDIKRMVVSRDNYILDGHHHWAAQIAIDAKDNKLGDIEAKVARVDIGIIDLLKEAEAFTGGKGHKRTFDPSEPRDEQGRWTDGGGDGGDSSGGAGDSPPSAGFVSPNVKTNLDFAGAVKELKSPQQQAMHEASAHINSALGLTGAHETSIIGAWSDGAENSVMMEANSDWDHTVLATVMKGHLADQKSVLVFQQQEGGHTVLAHFDAKGDLATIHANLLKDGLEFHTLVPTANGARVYVVDLDGSVADAIKTGASRYGADNKISVQFGRGEFIPPFDQQVEGTDREQRDGARRVYEEVIGRSPVSGAAKVWQDVRNRWGQGLSDEMKSYTAAQRHAINARAHELLNAFDPSEPRDEEGKWTDGGGDGGDGDTSVGAIPGLPKISGYAPGVKVSNDKAKVTATKTEWIATSPVKSIENLIAGGPIAQRALGNVGSKIAAKMKVEFKNPGPKTKSEKGIARTKDKIAARKGNAAAVTDVARATFVINKPEQSDAIAKELGKHFEVTLEDWRHNDQGYMDRAALVRFENGMIGEVQFMDPGMSDAKSDTGGNGHGLYAAWRALDPSKPAERVKADQLVQKMRDLYGGVTSGYAPDWKAVFGKSAI